MLHAAEDVVVAIASLISILDYFGLKPKELSRWYPMALNRKFKLIIMLGLVTAALGMSGYNFYRSLRPKIVEKLVEKVAERPVALPSPESTGKLLTKPKEGSHSTISQQQTGKNNIQSGSITQGSNSIAQVGITNQITVEGIRPPEISIAATTIQNVPDEDLFKSEFDLTVKADAMVPNLYIRVYGLIDHLEIVPRKPGLFFLGHGGVRNGYAFSNIQSAIGSYTITVYSKVPLTTPRIDNSFDDKN
ncbi:MAG: hypothetical protein ACRD5K_00725 [Candidatus Acidiferrales bacterium]